MIIMGNYRSKPIFTLRLTVLFTHPVFLAEVCTPADEPDGVVADGFALQQPSVGVDSSLVIEQVGVHSHHGCKQWYHSYIPLSFTKDHARIELFYNQGLSEHIYLKN